MKHGWLSGHWSLERGGETHAEAQKPSALFRQFEIRSGTLTLQLEAASALTRSYDILRAGHVIGTIRPAHPFTRRARVRCDDSVPEIIQLFAFWLAVLTWRRAANNNANSS